MPTDAIRQIRDAEEQAAILCRFAEERAAEMRENVRIDGEAYCTQAGAEAQAEHDAALAEMHRRAALLENKKRAEAQAEAQALAASARERIPEAVKLIVWEIIEKCQ
jgi:hypothetical protein